MSLLFGRLTTFVAGIAYFVFSYYGLFPDAPFARTIQTFFSENVLSALVILTVAIGGYIAANFFWQQPGVIAKTISLFAFLPLVTAMLCALSEDIGRSFGHEPLMFLVQGLFFASSIVLLGGAFLAQGNASTAGKAEH